ncbi:MAG: 3-deoxy-D-manno-octulosonic acid transferase [Elusimicrobia bacterium]|nr:3-deoxy-D-manno-octulosonic acid transferase [Elusimicrobiota bacterium]MBU2614860.1 3-deoxy-D-manno-octulosonic acid transferase [Elusimicrobiota bacterium]
MYFIYDLISFCAFVLLLPYVLFKLQSKNTGLQWRHRLGLIGNLPEGRYIWVHCASVGEVKVASLLIEELHKKMPDHKIVLSVITRSGYRVANDTVSSVKKVFYAPIDISLFVERTVMIIKPELFVLVETELWPNLIRLVDKSGAKIVTINGRISDKSYGAYKFLRFFIKKIVRKVDLFLMREQFDYDRIIELGAEKEKVSITGNIKYDIIISDNIKKYVVEKEYFGFNGGNKIFVAGSIREGEEELIIKAYDDLLNNFPQLKMIFSPRHLERVPLVEEMLEKRNISYVKKSNFLELKDFQCLILDVYGELMKAYYVADIVFVGGSLLPFGGQNIIEPASLGKVVMFGPYTESFKEPADLLVKNNAGIRVKDTEEMKGVITDYLEDPVQFKQYSINAKKVINKLEGVTKRTVELIKKFFDE